MDTNCEYTMIPEDFWEDCQPQVVGQDAGKQAQLLADQVRELTRERDAAFTGRDKMIKQVQACERALEQKENEIQYLKARLYDYISALGYLLDGGELG